MTITPDRKGWYGSQGRPWKYAQVILAIVDDEALYSATTLVETAKQKGVFGPPEEGGKVWVNNKENPENLPTRARNSLTRHAREKFDEPDGVFQREGNNPEPAWYGWRWKLILSKNQLTIWERRAALSAQKRTLLKHSREPQKMVRFLFSARSGRMSLFPFVILAIIATMIGVWLVHRHYEKRLTHQKLANVGSMVLQASLRQQRIANNLSTLRNDLSMEPDDPVRNLMHAAINDLNRLKVGDLLIRDCRGYQIPSESWAAKEPFERLGNFHVALGAP